MALAFTNLLEEANTTGGDPVTTSGSITTVAGRLYIISIISSTTATVSSVSIPGTATETFIQDELRGTLLNVTCYYAVPSVGGTGTVTVDFSGATTGTIIIVDEVTGQHATTPIVTTNVQVANGTDSTGDADVAITLPNALASADNAIYAAFGANANTTFAPVSPYTELGEGAHSAPTRTGATIYDVTPADLIADGTFTGAAQWAGVAFEIAEAAGTPINKSIVHASETGTAQPLSFSKPIHKTLGVVSEADVAQALVFSKTIFKTLGVVSETGTAQPLSTSQPIVVSLTPVAESGAAQALSYVKNLSLGVVSETGAAQPLVFTKPIFKSLGVVSETDVAQALSFAKAVSLSPVDETGIAQALSLFKQVVITPAEETGLAMGLGFSQGGAQNISITPVLEEGEAQALSFSKTIFKTISPALESGVAVRLNFDGGEEPVAVIVRSRIVIGRF